jgi:hypothetical protein
MERRLARSLAMALLVCLCGCAQFIQYRSDYTLCTRSGAQPAAQCDGHALQEVSGQDGTAYLLGFIEFDDQGQLWDRKQMASVLDKLNADAATRDLLLVVFVHGWKHSAAPGDTNIDTFRTVLEKIAEVEMQQSRLAGVPAREVAGVYLGWRGGSLTVPWIENLTFWERKNTALKVGHGGVAEVLAKLELVKLDKDSTVPGGSHTRLAVVGHSFGGLVVNAALSQILEARFVRTVGPAGQQSDVAGFGNLVVLINPAFEALAFAPLSDMSTERGSYFPSQLPVLVALTSEADQATRYAFPAGRWLSTFFEKTVPSIERFNGSTRKQEAIDEHQANLAAVGHFEPYRTHRLYPSEQTPGQVAGLSAEANLRVLRDASVNWAHDKPGSKIPFSGLTLERSTTSAGRNPYLMVYVDGRLIKDHNDIDDPRIIEFIKQVIMISTQTPERSTRLLQLPAAPTGQ